MMESRAMVSFISGGIGHRCKVAIVLAAVVFLAGAHPAGAASGNCFARVKTILTEHLGVEAEKVKPSANLIDDLGADKLDKVEIVMATEEEFGVKISDADARRFATVGDLVAYLSKGGRCTP
jgi:acyl carrier protein